MVIKLFGAAAIVAASAGFVGDWRRRSRLRIRQMEHICLFYRRAANGMETEKSRMPDFLEGYVKSNGEKQPALGAMLFRLRELLEEREYPTGAEAFRQAFSETEDAFYLAGEEAELFLDSADALFGKSLTENVQKLALYEARMQERCRSARAEFAEKNRVWTPMGLLLGAMLAILLL